MVENITIREATENDIQKVIEVNLIALPEHYTQDFWLDHLRAWGKAFLVAEVDNKVVGYVMCRVESGIGFLRRGLIKLGHVVSIAVLPEYRRKGIGRRIMEESIKRLKEYYNVSEIYLEVRVSNVPAINLYEKLGFRKVKTIKYYYLDGEDAFVMAKTL
ncbi:MAG: ribosomal protein S18-alanine N-acetyltransferase [Sulfolobales archaeon]|nr:ribosomal protein S18-alanine N-acetyltransferase [Sulfolobales archaeon]MCX8186534.1 ribosomal protein S18-alanine N-acetyltransferase [Sulfolobales archaeon]MDW7969082.1 ribosomal protein S18-alanine N-acetyltransferase [Sulfolobales archaeon]